MNKIFKSAVVIGGGYGGTTSQFPFLFSPGRYCINFKSLGNILVLISGGYLKKYYSKQGLWSLFLICAFPLHLWTLLLAFRDISWVAERSNFWDAIGVASYGMIFAFLESLLLFLPALLLGLLVPSKWGREKRLAIISVLVLMLAFSAMITQLYGLQVWSIPDALSGLLSHTAHPLRYIYMIALALVIPTMILPILMISRNKKALGMILNMVDRVSLLTMFYLLLDFFALVIVIIRNIL